MTAKKKKVVAKKKAVGKVKPAPASSATIEEQLSTSLSSLTTGLSAFKRAEGGVTAALEAETAQQTRLAELRVLTETAESDSADEQVLLIEAIDAVSSVLITLKASITD